MTYTSYVVAVSDVDARACGECSWLHYRLEAEAMRACSGLNSIKPTREYRVFRVHHEPVVVTSVEEVG